VELRARRRALARRLRLQRGGEPGWNQRWRRPLRDALDWLREQATRRSSESQARGLFRDPWAARDDYIDVVLDAPAARDAFLEAHAARPLDAPASACAR
jgi:hypothetical protein